MNKSWEFSSVASYIQPSRITHHGVSVACRWMSFDCVRERARQRARAVVCIDTKDRVSQSSQVAMYAVGTVRNNGRCYTVAVLPVPLVAIAYVFDFSKKFNVIINYEQTSGHGIVPYFGFLWIIYSILCSVKILRCKHIHQFNVLFIIRLVYVIKIINSYHYFIITQCACVIADTRMRPNNTLCTHTRAFHELCAHTM